MRCEANDPVPELPRWIEGERPFTSRDTTELNEAAISHGFLRRGQKNWVRRTCDFVQLINLQHSQWSAEDGYINFAIWPLRFGEPDTLAASKFPFRIRAESVARDLTTLLEVADRFESLTALREAYAARLLDSGFVSKEMRTLLEGA
jgi:hypothetical protein